VEFEPARSVGGVGCVGAVGLSYNAPMKPVLLCLHGWGGSKESFTELRAALKDVDLEILTPDLPGFGDGPEPDRPWTTDEYADWVVGWLRKELRMENGEWRIDRPVFVLGHSHGGRIAIKLAARLGIEPDPEPVSTKRTSPPLTFPIARLFLCAPAGIRHSRHFKRIIGLTLAKAGKFFLSIPGLRLLQPLGKKLLYTLVRVHDYEKASPIMRETLIKVSAEDLTPLLSSITVPTDIFWGSDDRMTPVTDAALFHDRLRHSSLHVFPGVRHAVHRDPVAIGQIVEAIRYQLH